MLTGTKSTAASASSPAEGEKTSALSAALSAPVGAGRGLNPRPERSTHAKAGEQRTKNRNQKIDFGGGFPDLELREDI